MSKIGVRRRRGREGKGRVHDVEGMNGVEGRKEERRKRKDYRGRIGRNSLPLPSGCMWGRREGQEQTDHQSRRYGVGRRERECMGKASRRTERADTPLGRPPRGFWPRRIQSAVVGPKRGGGRAKNSLRGHWGGGRAPPPRSVKTRDGTSVVLCTHQQRSTHYPSVRPPSFRPLTQLHPTEEENSPTP